MSPCCSNPNFNLIEKWDPDTGNEGSFLVSRLEIIGCDGKTVSKCSTSRNYDAETLVHFAENAKAFSSHEELEAAESIWATKFSGEGFEEVWEREWAISGTCIKSISPECNSALYTGDEVAIFFSMIERLHDGMNLLKGLEQLGDVTPTSQVSYSAKDFRDAIVKATGFHPILKCRDETILSSIVFPLATDGDALAPTFHSRESDTRNESDLCPEEGIMFVPSPSTIKTPIPPAPTWDPIRRPALRPITIQAKPTPPVIERLGFFKGADEGREEVKVARPMKKSHRDEL